MAQEAKILSFPEHSSVGVIFKLSAGNKKNRYPFFSSKISAGFPSPADDYIQRKPTLDELLIRDPASTFITTVSGNSMFPLICDGDELIVDKDERV